MSDTPKARIATIKGYWAKPGVSLNRRLYRPEHIAEAAREAQEQIDGEGESPRVFTMLTHHGARDPKAGDVTATAGRLTKVGTDERGWGTFEADVPDTSAGRDVAALITADNPYLTGVSMASVWKGPPTMTVYEGTEVETCDEGFSLRGIDFTHNPGIPGGAKITSAVAEDSGEELLLESVPENRAFVEAVVDEAANKKPYGDVAYADPGYQADKKKRYPIDTTDHVRAAWAYINKGKNAGKYSSNQLSRIKGRIKSAAKRMGIDIAEDFKIWGLDIIEAYTSMGIDNGAGSISVSSWLSDPTDLDKAARVVAMSAMSALAAMDPDNDGDLDLDRFTPGGMDDDGPDGEGYVDACPNCGNPILMSGDQFCPACGTSLIAGESAPEQKEGEMPDSKEQEGAPPEESVLTDREKLLVAEAIKATREEMSKPPEESDELKAARALVAAADEGKAPPPPADKPAADTSGESALPSTPEELAKLLAETSKKAATEAVEAVKDSMIEEVRKSQGGPRRRGHVSKGILEQSDEELYGDDGPGFRGKNLRGKSAGELEKIADQVFSPVISDVAS